MDKPWINHGYWGMILAIDIHPSFPGSACGAVREQAMGCRSAWKTKRRGLGGFFHPKHWTLNMGKALDDEFFFFAWHEFLVIFLGWFHHEEMIFIFFCNDLVIFWDKGDGRRQLSTWVKWINQKQEHTESQPVASVAFESWSNSAERRKAFCGNRVPASSFHSTGWLDSHR